VHTSVQNENDSLPRIEQESSKAAEYRDILNKATQLQGTVQKQAAAEHGKSLSLYHPA
jgi:hypothetical protein